VLSLTEIQDEIDRLAQVVQAEAQVLPTYGHSDGGEGAHVEADGRSYYYVVMERGREIDRFFTIDLDDLLYRVFDAITFSLAVDYGREHRIEGEDSRRIVWQRQLELLGRLSPNLRERTSWHIRQVLANAPYIEGKHA